MIAANDPLALSFDQLNAEGPGVAWPKLLFGQTASLFSALYSMNLTERLPAAQINTLQEGELARLLTHASTHVPYYRDVLNRAGFNPGKTGVGEIWNRLPILTRSDLQEREQDLRADSVPQAHGAIRERSTSGSTSRPVRVAATDLTGFLWTCANMRERSWHRVDFGGTLAVLADGVKGMGNRPVVEAGSWSLPPSALVSPGKQFQINPMLPVLDQIREIGKLEPTYLHTRPSQLNLLVKACKANRVRFDSLRGVFCISEIVTDSLRQACRDVLGAELIENYSCAELGHLALQCPEAGKMHVQSELVRLEILNANDKPCAPGEIGRVVATSLHNYATPLIRYELGDEAEVGRPCACGRGLPVIEKVIGRTQDCLILPSGNSVRINTYHYRIARIPKIREFQIVQHSTSQLEVRLAADMPLDKSETRQLTSWFEDQGEHRLAVEITYCKAIERTKAGKLRTFISEVR